MKKDGRERTGGVKANRGEDVQNMNSIQKETLNDKPNDTIDDVRDEDGPGEHFCEK